MFTSQQVPTELLASLGSHDIVACIRAALPKVAISNALEEEGGKGEQNFVDVNKIIAAAISQDVLRVWDLIKSQQLREIGGLMSCAVARGTFDERKLTGVQKSPEMLFALSKLKVLNNEREVSYFEMLENYDRIREAVIDIKYRQKTFYAALCAQIELMSKVIRYKKSAADRVKTEGDADPRANPTGVALPSNVNVKIDPASFLDLAFLSVKFSKPCTWFRANEIPPEARSVLTQ